MKEVADKDTSDKQEWACLKALREEMQTEVKGRLYHRTQVAFAYNSNHMEGSRLTEEQTRYIFETNTIGLTREAVNVDDIMENVLLQGTERVGARERVPEGYLPHGTRPV